MARVDAVIVDFPNLHIMHTLKKPLTLRSNWQRQDNSSDCWAYVWFFAELSCLVRISQWPVLSNVYLRLAMRRSDEKTHGSTAFSIGWCTTSSASQLARVGLGQCMSAADDLVHVCMLHFSSVRSGSWHPQTPLTLQYMQGQVGSGFDESRVVDMSSPFVWTDHFHLHLQLDIPSNVIHLTVDGCDGAVRVPSFFLEARSPDFLSPCWASPLPRWHFFAFVDGANGPLAASRLQVDFLDMPPRLCEELLTGDAL